MLQMFRFSRLLFWLGGAGILILASLAIILYVMPPLRDTGDIVYLQAMRHLSKCARPKRAGRKLPIRIRVLCPIWIRTRQKQKKRNTASERGFA